MIAWTLATLLELDGIDVHDLLALRCQVFVLEQRCPYLDIDGSDPLPGTRHVLARDTGRLIACARSLAPLRPGGDTRIGRVVVAASHRRRGIARSLMERVVADLDRRRAGVAQRLDAQVEAVPFYESLGFQCCGEPFLEDGIAHVIMRRVPAGPAPAPHRPRPRPS